MEKSRQMLALFGLNILFYLIDLFILYKRYFENVEKFYGTFNFEILFSFMFSLLLMLPVIGSYFILYNFGKDTERVELFGSMVLITMINLIFLLMASVYVR